MLGFFDVGRSLGLNNTLFSSFVAIGHDFIGKKRDCGRNLVLGPGPALGLGTQVTSVASVRGTVIR